MKRPCLTTSTVGLSDSCDTVLTITIKIVGLDVCLGLLVFIERGRFWEELVVGIWVEREEGRGELWEFDFYWVDVPGLAI